VRIDDLAESFMRYIKAKEILEQEKKTSTYYYFLHREEQALRDAAETLDRDLKQYILNVIGENTNNTKEDE
jgi:hypothetical protein